MTKQNILTKEQYSKMHLSSLFRLHRCGIVFLREALADSEKARKNLDLISEVITTKAVQKGLLKPRKDGKDAMAQRRT